MVKIDICNEDILNTIIVKTLNIMKRAPSLWTHLVIVYTYYFARGSGSISYDPPPTYKNLNLNYKTNLWFGCFIKTTSSFILSLLYLSFDMRFPTMWYV